MTKKGLLVLVLVIMVTGGVFAQNWYDSYAPGIDDSILFINGGVGVGPSGIYSRGIPPISLSVDVKLPIPLPITVGVMGIMSTWRYSPYLFSYAVTYRNIGIAARGMYHFNFARNLDVYAGLTLGYAFQTATVSGSYYGSTYSGSPFFLYGGKVGVRYFFTSFLGVYAEAGYSGLQYANGGLTLKF